MNIAAIDFTLLSKGSVDSVQFSDKLSIGYQLHFSDLISTIITYIWRSTGHVAFLLVSLCLVYACVLPVSCLEVIISTEEKK